MGEVLHVPLIAVDPTGRLIGLRFRDCPNQFFEVELRRHEVFGQRGKQPWIRWRICVTEVVFWLDQSAAKEVLPVAVHEHSREKGIRGRCHPVDEHQPGILVGGDRLWQRAERDGQHRGRRPRIREARGAALVEDEILVANG